MTFKLLILARDLSSALSACAHAVDGGSKIPILKTVRIQIDGETASFMATNTEITIVTKRQCEGSGSACVDLAALAQKVSTLKQDDFVRIEGEEKSVTVSQKKSRWKLPVLFDDWPIRVADPLAGDPVAIGSDFVAALQVARGSVQPGALTNYGGIWTQDGHVISVDGRQMRFIDTGTDIGMAIFHPSIADRMKSLFPNGADAILSENAAEFSSDDLRMKTRLMAYQMSDWRAGREKFEGMSKNECAVDRDGFLAALKRASAIGASGERQGAFINMQVRFRADKIEIFTRNIAGEEGLDEIAIACPIEADVGMNGGLLIGAVDTLKGELRVRYGDASCPILLEPVGAEKADMRVVFPRVFS